MDLDPGHFGPLQNLITVKIGLVHLATGEGQFGMKNGSQAEADSAFHLGADLVGIDGYAAIRGTEYTFNLEASPPVHGYFRHLYHHGLEGFMDSDTTETTG